MAVVTRASSAQIFGNNMRNINTVQQRLFSSQEQVSSGFKAKNFAELTGEVEQFVFLEGRLKKIEAYEVNNNINVSRLETVKMAFDNITEIADDMEDLITLRRNGAIGQDVAFDQQMKSFIQSIASQLNTTYEGRFLFSGTATNIQPVAVDPSVPEPHVSGVPDKNYYRGSEESPTLRADDNVEFAAIPRADDPVFQKLFAGAYRALEGNGTDDDEVIVEGLDIIQEGLEELIAKTASVNADIVGMNNIIERQTNLKLYYKGVTEEIAAADVLDLSTKISFDQAVLSASFQAFATINSLRLSDYL